MPECKNLQFAVHFNSFTEGVIRLNFGSGHWTNQTYRISVANLELRSCKYQQSRLARPPTVSAGCSAALASFCPLLLPVFFMVPSGSSSSGDVECQAILSVLSVNET